MKTHRNTIFFRKERFMAPVGAALIVTVIFSTMLFLNTVKHAYAADAVSSAEYLDTDLDGQVDTIRWTMDETVTSCTYEAGDWSVDTASEMTLAITGLTCTGADANLDIDISADADETGAATDPVISYADNGTVGSVALASGGMTAKASQTAIDGAAPAISTFSYLDQDVDGRVDAVEFNFSESVDASSVFSANDVIITSQIGGISGASFDADSTDLIVGSVSTVTVPFGTEASSTDTDGFIQISTQNSFSLEDAAGNTNSTLGDLGYATDGAAPVVDQLRYEDLDGNAKIDRITLFFTEFIYQDSVVSQDDLLFSDVGDFTGLAFSSDATDLATSFGGSLVIDIDEPSVQDTRDNSVGLELSSQNNFKLVDQTGNENTTLGAMSFSFYQDLADPQMIGAEYQDADSDGRIDQIEFTFSEDLGATSVLSANDLIFDDVGDFTGVTFGTDSTNLVTAVTSSVVMPLETESTQIDTSEDSGTIEISSQNLFELRDIFSNGNTTLATQSNITYTDGADVVVVGSNPADSGVLFPLNKTIEVTFSEEMDLVTIDDIGSEITVAPSPGGIILDASTNAGFTTMTIDHDAFNINESVTVTIDSGAGALDGSTIGTNFVFSFIAKASIGGDGSGASNVPKTYMMDLLTPNGGGVYSAGDVVDVTWESGGTGKQPFVTLSYSTDGGSVFTNFASVELNDGHYAWTVPDITSDQFRVRVIGTDLALALATDTSSTNFSVIGSVPLVDSPTETDAPQTDETGTSPVTGEEEPISQVQTGDIIKGKSFDTLYWVTDDLRRRPFMNEAIYFTWKNDFNDVLVVTDATLGTLPLGGPMLPKYGTGLFKLQTENRVYVVEHHPTDVDRAVRRWIPSEEIAKQLIGLDWAEFVIDLPDTLFGRFSDGMDITVTDTFDRSVMVKRRGL